MTTTHDIQPDVFFVSRWGYDQTNIDFYKVIAVTAKSVRIQKWITKVQDGRVTPGDWPATDTRIDWTRVTAGPEDWGERLDQIRAATSEVPVAIRSKKVKHYGSEPFLDLTSYSNAYLWDGRPKFDTLAAGEAGH